MDPRRASSRSVIDPKVRHVGFFAPPESTTTLPLPFPNSPLSTTGNSLSPVMIPPPPTRSLSPLQRDSVGSYNPSSEFSSPSSAGRRRSSGKFASSLPAGVFQFPSQFKQKNLTTVSVVSNNLTGICFHF